SRNTPSGKYSVRAHSIAKTLRHDCDNYFSSSPDSYRCSTITRRFGAVIAQRLWPISFRRRRVSCLYRFWAGRHGRFLLHRWSVTTTTTGIRGHPEHLGNLAGAAPSWYHRHFHPWRSQGHIARQLAAKGVDRFADINTQVNDDAIFIDDAALWLKTTRYAEYPAGDHLIALLEVTNLADFTNINEPLVFHKSQFRNLENN